MESAFGIEYHRGRENRRGEALELLRSTSGVPLNLITAQESARRLVRLFDHHPLAISLASFYIAQHYPPESVHFIIQRMRFHNSKNRRFSQRDWRKPDPVTAYMTLLTCTKDGRGKITPHGEGTAMTDGVAAAVNATYHMLTRSNSVAVEIIDFCGRLDASSGVWEELFLVQYSRGTLEAGMTVASK